MQTSTNIMSAKLPELPTDLPLPPLPTISSSQIQGQVFTHSSAVPRANKSLFEMGGLEDNEKLEHVGDSLVSTCTDWLYTDLHRYQCHPDVAPALPQHSTWRSNSMSERENRG